MSDDLRKTQPWPEAEGGEVYEPQKCRDCGDTFTPEDGESLCADCFERDREYAAQVERDERAWEWDLNNRIKAAREDR